MGKSVGVQKMKIREKLRKYRREESNKEEYKNEKRWYVELCKKKKERGE